MLVHVLKYTPGKGHAIAWKYLKTDEASALIAKQPAFKRHNFKIIPTHQLRAWGLGQ